MIILGQALYQPIPDNIKFMQYIMNPQPQQWDVDALRSIYSKKHFPGNIKVANTCVRAKRFAMLHKTP